MYSDYTYENIMKAMMEELPDGVNTDEGSLIWHSCVKQALFLEEAYLSMQSVEDNMYTDTQDEEHLIQNGADQGLPIEEETCAIVKAEFYQEIGLGLRFTANQLNYRVLEQITGNIYKLQCETEGTIGNITGGELSPIDFVDAFLGGHIIEILIPGTDREDIELYRKKILALNDTKYFGGNRADYIRFIEAISGVGSCKVKRRTSEDATIYPYILDAAYSIPSSELIQLVQDFVNPEENSGEGYGIAPIGHVVKIMPADGVEINIASEIIYDEGYSQEAVQSYLDNAVDNYFLELKKTWKSTNSMIVRIAQIEARLLGIPGIIDISGTKLNGAAWNITLSYTEVPVRGTINGI